MKNKKKRKGFTLVELLVVIAILAVLATVAILGYTQFTKKANIANDQAICSQMNLALQSNEALDNKAQYAHQAVGQCQDAGFILENLTPSTANYNFAYDQQHNRFMLLDDKFNFNFGDDKHTEVKKENNYWIYVVVGNEKELKDVNNEGFSTYLREEFVFANETNTINTDKGIDVGACLDVASIVYDNSEASEGQDVVVRTNSFLTKLTINAPKDTVQHYDYASSVDVTAIKDASYDEFGTVGRVEVKKGHVEAMDGSEIFCLMEAPATDGAVKGTTVNTGAIVHTNMENINAAEGIVKDENTGVGNGHIDDCGAGKHSFSQLVVDEQHVYDVCTCCGYTLITIRANIGTVNEVEFKQSLNVLDENGKVSSENATPVEEYNLASSVSIPVKKETVDGKKVNVIDFDNANAEAILKDIVEVKEDGKVSVREDKIESKQETPVIDPEKPVNPTCVHVWSETTTPATCTKDGSKVKTCTKCGATFTTVLKALGHDFSGTFKDNGDGTHSRKCSRCNEYGNKISHNISYTSNEDGTHNGSCICGKTITNEKCDTNGKDNACSKCEYKKETVSIESLNAKLSTITKNEWTMPYYIFCEAGISDNDVRFAYNAGYKVFKVTCTNIGTKRRPSYQYTYSFATSVSNKNYDFNIVSDYTELKVKDVYAEAEKLGTQASYIGYKGYVSIDSYTNGNFYLLGNFDMKGHDYIAMNSCNNGQRSFDVGYNKNIDFNIFGINMAQLYGANWRDYLPVHYIRTNGGMITIREGTGKNAYMVHYGNYSGVDNKCGEANTSYTEIGPNEWDNK